MNDLTPAERLKFLLLERGVRITPTAIEYIDGHNGSRPMTPADYASTSGVILELDDARRRLLVKRLSTAGQVIVTTTNRHYFTESELERATVISLPLGGSIPSSQGSPGTLEDVGAGGER